MKKIFVQKDSLKFELTKDILNNLWKDIEIINYEKYWDVINDIFININIDKYNIDYNKYKVNLENRNKYLFLKKWTNLIVEDKWEDYNSFSIYKDKGYKVFNVKIGQNCSLWCKYCYLLSTQKQRPELAIYCNVKEETNKFIKKYKWEKIVLNLWEYTDSFLYDSLTNLNRFFYNICLENPNIIVETRTKLNNFKIDFPPIKNFILAFSISINNLDNFWTKKLTLKKLNNINLLTQKWYMVAIKFDPIVRLDWYDDDFFNIIKEMDLNFIHHFSIWTLRFTRSLKNIMTTCSPNIELNSNFEYVIDKYVNKQRMHIYNFFINKMKQIWVNEYYLSMEPKL